MILIKDILEALDISKETFSERTKISPERLEEILEKNEITEDEKYAILGFTGLDHDFFATGYNPRCINDVKVRHLMDAKKAAAKNKA